jgi:hypothetical protein
MRLMNGLSLGFSLSNIYWASTAPTTASRIVHSVAAFCLLVSFLIPHE